MIVQRCNWCKRDGEHGDTGWLTVEHQDIAQVFGYDYRDKHFCSFVCLEAWAHAQWAKGAHDPTRYRTERGLSVNAEPVSARALMEGQRLDDRRLAGHDPGEAPDAAAAGSDEGADERASGGTGVPDGGL